MTIFHREELDNLTSPSLALAVARRTDELAREQLAMGRISNFFFKRDIYVPGVEFKLPSGITYEEISYYSDGFGGSLFVRGDEMLMLNCNHELAALDAINGDRDLYLTPLLRGLPRRWDFVVDMLQVEERFRWNPPVGVFWFRNGSWRITNELEAIANSSLESKLHDYRDGVTELPLGEFSAIFAHGGKEYVDDELIMSSQLNEWIGNFD